MLKGAFNLIINLHSRVATISRPGTVLTGSIKISPSNYFRHLEATGDIVSTGREFVISSDSLAAISFGKPKRGDKIVDSSLGTMTVTEARDLFDLGAEVIGYRVRTD